MVKDTKTVPKCGDVISYKISPDDNQLIEVTITSDDGTSYSISILTMNDTYIPSKNIYDNGANAFCEKSCCIK